jgi:hypothetical protein
MARLFRSSEHFAYRSTGDRLHLAIRDRLSAGRKNGGFGNGKTGGVLLGKKVHSVS